MFEKIVSIESLFESWLLFRRGKRARADVIRFEHKLEDNLFLLQEALLNQSYRHGTYQQFFVRDPKVRSIHKSDIADRLVHQALCLHLAPLFERSFYEHSYSAQVGKGTHRGFDSFSSAARRVSKNFKKPCWALKCDIRKFYDSIDHAILLRLIGKKVTDERVFWLCREVIESFSSEGRPGKGIPIGNLTSQLFGNIYLHELDFFVTRTLGIADYFRYADDFVFISRGPSVFAGYLPKLRFFLETGLHLELHPAKVTIKPIDHGLDFLGFVVLPFHCQVRTTTKRRMLRRLASADLLAITQSLNSYLGHLSHADSYELSSSLKNMYSR